MPRSHPIPTPEGPEGLGASPLRADRAASPAGLSPASGSSQSGITGAIADVLERAADLIEPEGAWGQGGEIGTFGYSRPCIGVAIEKCCEVERCSDDAVRLARESLLACGFPTVDAAMNWNDAPERTQSEVVAKLREAAAAAREQGK